MSRIAEGGVLLFMSRIAEGGVLLFMMLAYKSPKAEF